MISFDNFKAEGESPIYLQVILHVKRMIAAGLVSDGEELPSRRVLSALLGINPNTVQKAYKGLEEEGLIESRTGAGSVIAVSDSVMEKIKKELMEGEAQSVIGAMKKMGITKEDALYLIDKLWGDESNEEE